MTKIICLANSRKYGARCIAGIDVNTGRWVRPVSSTRSDGAIPEQMQRIEDEDVKLLDVLAIPLERSGPDYEFQPENRLVARGTWRKVGQVGVEKILPYCENIPFVLHNRCPDRVPWKFIEALPSKQKKSLQLVRARRVEFRKATSASGRIQVRASFPYRGNRYDMVVTDLVAERRTKRNTKISSDCILTISLGGPFPEHDPDPQCYKLVAGVVEL